MYERLIFDVFKLLDKVRNYPMFVMFSGGKDSTVVLDLIGRYVVKHGYDSDIYVVYNDVWLDPPPVREWVYSVLSYVKSWSNYKFNVVVINPPRGKDFFTLMLERGWAAPVVRMHAPWCNKEMKTRPTARFIRRLMAVKGYRKVVYVVGARASESIRRRRSLRSLGAMEALRSIRMEYLGEVFFLAPIYNWLTWQVFKYMKEFKRSVFGFSFEPLLSLYKYAVDGRLRVGCWVCPQVSRDYFMEMYVRDHPEYKILLDVRKKIIEISENPKYRTAISKNGHPSGRLTIEGRKLIALELKKLLSTGIGRKVMKDYLKNTYLEELIDKVLNYD